MSVCSTQANVLGGPDNVPRHGPKETKQCASTAAIDRYLGEKDAWKMFLVEDANKKESAKHAASVAPKQADDLLAEMSSDMEAHQGVLFVLMQSHTDPGCDVREPQAWLRVMLMDSVFGAAIAAVDAWLRSLVSK